ncbi:serine carboxypeptidase [Aureococcus anophagefferens]|nr:serine carboxypeptidase [Aureococcus anophagefferens]
MQLSLLACSVLGITALNQRFKHLPKTVYGNGTKEAVFVTPYLPERYTEAQALTASKVGDFPIHAGFLTLDSKAFSNTYFVYSPARNGQADAPILLWLQGGPGASSLFGLFTEIGPFDIDAKMEVISRDIHWNEDHHLLVLDNPLGTGFSFTNDLAAMATDEDMVGAALLEALTQFFALFPDLRTNDFYVTGESYAGKYVPACAYAIHGANAGNAAAPINLRGIAIGDGAFDPSGQFYNFGELLYYSGMVTLAEKQVFDAYEAKWREHMDAHELVDAFHVFDEMLNGDIYPYATYYANVTGMGSNYFNLNQGPDGSSLTTNYFIDWLNTTVGRDAMNVGDVPYAVLNQTVENQLLGDWMRGVVNKLQVLLENYKVLIYSGAYDIILGAPLTEQALRGIKWSGQQAFLDATKKTWHVATKAGPDLAGYARVVGNFTQVVVRGAGNMVPGDQPARALDMITKFVKGQPLGI